VPLLRHKVRRRREMSVYQIVGLAPPVESEFFAGILDK